MTKIRLEGPDGPVETTDKELIEQLAAAFDSSRLNLASFSDDQIADAAANAGFTNTQVQRSGSGQIAILMTVAPR